MKLSMSLGPLGWLLVMALVLMFALPRVPLTMAFSNGEAASLVLGQPDFRTNSSSPSTWMGPVNPWVVAFDPSGNLWTELVPDGMVIEYKAPLTSGMSPSLVIGAPSDDGAGLSWSANSGSPNALSNPQGISFDRSGDLWVVDSYGQRVLEYMAPFSNGEPPSVSINQTAGGQNTNATGWIVEPPVFKDPTGIAFDGSGDLWIADFGNNRVLEYSPPFSNGSLPSLVVGQANLTSTFHPTSPDCYGKSCTSPYEPYNQTTSDPATTRGGMIGPEGVTFDTAGDLWVADSGNSRVLEFTPPFSDGMEASHVVGEPTFTANTTAITITQHQANVPESVAFDKSGDLWVSDTRSNRVLEFIPPFTDGMNASVVLGQPDFFSYSSALSQGGFDHAKGIAFDPSGNLWVADSGNNRILEFSVNGAAQGSTTQTESSGPSGGGGGIPEFPYQLVAVAAFTAFVAASYFAIRRRGTGKSDLART